MKFRLARVLLDNKPYAQGARPYQDFALLIDLRDALTHAKGIELYEVGPDGSLAPTKRPPKVFDQLRSENILAEVLDPTSQNWFNIMAMPAVARWGLTSASTMIRSLIDAMPDGEFANMVALDVLDFRSVLRAGTRRVGPYPFT
jgi:hypothetical protein